VLEDVIAQAGWTGDQRGIAACRYRRRRARFPGSGTDVASI